MREGRREFLPCPHFCRADKRQGQLSSAHTLEAGSPSTSTSRASSTVLPRYVQGLLSSVAAGEGQHQLSHSDDLGASSLACCRWQGASMAERLCIYASHISPHGRQNSEASSSILATVCVFGGGVAPWHWTGGCLNLAPCLGSIQGLSVLGPLLLGPRRVSYSLWLAFKVLNWTGSHLRSPPPPPFFFPR